MTASCTSRAADLPFPLEYLVSYDTKKFLRTKDFEKISHFLSRFALGQLLDSLGLADHPLPLWILVSYSLDITVTKRIVYNDKFFHLQMAHAGVNI